jgi:hypothetical protein
VQGNGEVEGFDGFGQREVEVQAAAMARADQQSADETNGFKGGADFSDRLGMAIGTVDINVYKSIQGMAVEANADQDLWILPPLPQRSRFEGIGGDGAPLGFLARDGGGGFKEIPGLLTKEVVKLLTQDGNRGSGRHGTQPRVLLRWVR